MWARNILKEGRRFARCVVRFGHPIALATRYFNLCFKRHFSPDEIHFLHLLDPALTPEHLARVTSNEELLIIQCCLNDRRFHEWTEDKLTFQARCLQAELPVPRLLAACSRNPGVQLPIPIVTDPNDLVAAILRRDSADLILKPTHGVHGSGVTRLTRRGAGWADPKGVAFTPESFAHLRQRTKYDEWLVQQCIIGHPSLRQLSDTDTLQTYRIVTLIDERREVRVIYAKLRLACSGNTTDNFDHGRKGNVTAALDIDSGRIASARGSTGPDPEAIALSTHPLTHRSLTGFPVPFWPDAVRLAKSAAVAFYPLVTVGWDIAAGEDAVHLIEGNVTWDPSNDIPRWPEIYAELLSRYSRTNQQAAASC